MISKEEGTKIVESFMADVLPGEGWYANVQPYIQAILLYGSVAKGTDHKDSDIDVLVILPIAVEEKYTTGEYFYVYKGHEINIVIRSVERLRKIAGEANDKFQQEVFRNCQIIESRDEVLSLLEKIAAI